MSINVSKSYFVQYYRNNKESFILNQIDKENSVLISKTPISFHECRFRYSLYMNNDELIKVTLVAASTQNNEEYIGISDREIIEKWSKNIFGEPTKVEVYGYRYNLLDAEMITEHDPRSGSNIITIRYNKNDLKKSDSLNVNDFSKTNELYKNICNNVLSGTKVPHSTSQPVLHMEKGKYYLSVFTFFYSREDIENGAVERPTMWAIADIETGEIIEERQTKEIDFSDASYDVKYNVRSDAQYDTSKKYYDDAFAILDSVREKIISTGKLYKLEYKYYLDKILANIPKDYQRFYTDLSV